MNQKKSDKPWCIYLIKNKLDQLYTGITLDIARRFYEHASASPKCAKALKGKAPLELMFCAQISNQSEALKLERWLKKQTRKTKDQIVIGKAQLPITHEVINPSEIHSQVMLKIEKDQLLKCC
jgi:putative endonuclease